MSLSWLPHRSASLESDIPSAWLMFLVGVILHHGRKEGVRGRGEDEAAQSFSVVHFLVSLVLWCMWLLILRHKIIYDYDVCENDAYVRYRSGSRSNEKSLDLKSKSGFRSLSLSPFVFLSALLSFFPCFLLELLGNMFTGNWGLCT